MNKTVSIYGLFDPRNGQLRYIGQSSKPKDRCSFHSTRYNNTSSLPWIQSLHSCGLKPEMNVLEESDTEHADEVEHFFISYFLSIGCDLYNKQSGGKGGKRLHPLSPEIKAQVSARCSAIHKGKIVSEETRRKLSEAGKGRTYSDEYKRNMSERLKGRVFSVEHKAKLGALRHTPETKAKIGTANSKRVWTEESRRKVSETLKRIAQEKRANLAEDPSPSSPGIARQHPESVPSAPLATYATYGSN